MLSSSFSTCCKFQFFVSGLDVDQEDKEQLVVGYSDNYSCNTETKISTTFVSSFQIGLTKDYSNLKRQIVNKTKQKGC